MLKLVKVSHTINRFIVMSCCQRDWYLVFYSWRISSRPCI